MAFVVETGSGLSNATSYVSDTDADTYLTSYGNVPTAWSGALAGAKQEALNSATRFIDARYGRKWQGRRTLRAQALDWPRYDVCDHDGYYIESTVVPQQVKDAASILAAKHLELVADGSSLLPDDERPGSISFEKVKLDVLEESIAYSGGSGSQTLYALSDSILKELLKGSGSGRVCLG